MANWKYKLKTGLDLRKAINDENHEEVLKCLEASWREINKQFPNDYEQYDLDDDIAEIENQRDNLYNYEDYDMTIEDVEENINYLLSNFYDYCDNMRIWIGI